MNNKMKEDSFLPVFEAAYSKFSKMVQDYELIPDDIDKVSIGMSGGKDAQVMALMLHEFKYRERNDLELELLTATTPAWKFRPDEFFKKDSEQWQYAAEQKKAVDVTRKFWEEKGIPTVYVDQAPGVDENVIYNAKTPCVMCFIGLYRAMCEYLSKEYKSGKKVTLSVGITKFDLLYVLESLTIRSSGRTWEEDKKNYPSKYYFNRLQTSFFSPYPKILLGIPDTDITKITPIVNLTDNETRYIANAMNLPRIADPCAKLYGERFVSDKRSFDAYLASTTTEDMNLDHVNSGFFAEYQSLLDTFTRLGILPPKEDIDNILYPAINNQDIISIYN
ncbi:tRNA lysidine(34) synthetase [Anaeromicropila populeti]|uniref:tRNA(Ile)-lysidine synthase TilS/MesJ n=1 Tax=Anaeromicropila populeti TaxID=37658 RepID=A0A1I6HSQ2_9FIRM|nr:hypothetical protein [Anaeromicropila populeti]SFR57492.1 hypothetical protein SAMN05661086_00251 [Anaeromicropila populeti]